MKKESPMPRSNLEQRSLVEPAQAAPYDLEVQQQPDAFAKSHALTDSTILIHVRFRPDGIVWEITECPKELTKEEWFKRLCARAGGKFQARCGGRGMFRLSVEELEAMKATHAH